MPLTPEQQQTQAQNEFVAEYLNATLAVANEQLAYFKQTAAYEVDIAERQQVIADAQWQTYKDLYLPIERRVGRQTLGGLLPEYQAQKAKEYTERSFDTAEEVYDRRLERLGVEREGRAYDDAQRMGRLEEAAAGAGLATAVRDASIETNKAREAAVTGVGQGIPSQAAQVMSAASQQVAQAGNTYGMGAAGLLTGNATLMGVYEQQRAQGLDVANQFAVSKISADALRASGQAQGYGAAVGGVASGLTYKYGEYSANKDTSTTATT